MKMKKDQKSLKKESSVKKKIDRRDIKQESPLKIKKDRKSLIKKSPVKVNEGRKSLAKEPSSKMKRETVILVSLSLLLLVLGGIVYKIHTNRQEAARLARDKIAAEEAVRKAAQEKYDNALSALSKKISAGELKTEKEFTSLLKEVDAFKKRYKDKNISETIKSFKKSIADRKSQRIVEIMKELAQQVAPLLKQENYTDAATLYINYKSDFHKETLSERTKIHDSLIAKANTLKQEAEALAIAEKNRKEQEKKALLQQIVIAVFEENPKNAYKILKDSPYTEDLKTENEILKNMITADRIVMKSFASDVGKTLDVRLKKGGTRKLKIIEIKNGKIIAEADSGSIKMQKKISLDMLSVKEKIKRLSRVDEVASAIVYGLYLVKKKQYKTAETSFSKTGSFADILSGKAADLAAEEAKALAAKQAAIKAKKLAELEAREMRKKKKSRYQGKNPEKNPNLWSDLVPKRKRNFYISPDGKPRHSGSKASPWDFESVVTGRQRVPPGSVVWVRQGVYEGYGLKMTLSGEAGKPVHFRAYPGERATVNGGLNITASYLWVWGIEFAIQANWRPKEPLAGVYTLLGALMKKLKVDGAINVLSGTDSKYINLILHNDTGGASIWKSCVNTELHGSMIYDNGWVGTDRAHGPGLYLQNNTGTVRMITDNILADNYSTGIQIRASNQKDWCNDFLIEGNVWCAPGAGSGRRNYLMPASGVNSNIIMKNNFIYGYQLRTHSGPGSEFKDNLVWRGRIDGPGAGDNTREEKPKKTKIIIRPNKYDPRRANLIVANSKHKSTVSVNLGDFLEKGDYFRILNAFDFFGEPSAEGTYNGSKIKLTMPEYAWDLHFHYSQPGSSKEFAVFIIMKE